MMPTENRMRRALLFMPGDSRRKIEKGAGLGVDSIIMDLEDAIALNQKEKARQSVAQALREVDFGQTEKLVRTNMIVQGWLYLPDILETVEALPDGYVLPKIETPDQIAHVASILTEAERDIGLPQQTFKMLAIIETAKGIINLREIAQASPRLDALIFGAEDLAGDIGATRTPQGWEVFYARSAVVMHARAFGLQAIDTVFIDLTASEEAIITETTRALEMGYTGKLAIHPRQVAPMQSVFTPTPQAVAQARRLIEAFNAQQSQGTGVFEYEGKMIDMPMVRSAMSIVDRARACGMILDDSPQQS